MILFFTGTIAFDEDDCWTVQLPHFDFEHDDVVLHRADFFVGMTTPSKLSGYVSSVGNNVIIHIKEQLNTPENIDYIKKTFSFKEDFGLQVSVVTMSNEEIANCGVSSQEASPVELEYPDLDDYYKDPSDDDEDC